MFERTGKRMSRKESREFTHRTTAALEDKRLSETCGLKTGSSAPRPATTAAAPETSG